MSREGISGLASRTPFDLDQSKASRTDPPLTRPARPILRTDAEQGFANSRPEIVNRAPGVNRNGGQMTADFMGVFW
jgi:hypothetical protein